MVYTVSPDGNIEARLSVAYAGQVNMTMPFDPALPSPSARSAINRLLLRLSEAGDKLTAAQLLEPLEAAPLRRQFYEDVAKWTGRIQKGKDLPQRQAVLRHLVRVMFTWILKEENIIPPELFEQAFANAYLPDADGYHREVLRFLFHQRVNVPSVQWDEHPVPNIETAMAEVPFLNGSLFAEHPDDSDLEIPANAYWSTDEQEPGLFTILARYHWTMDEHRPGESEQTLDPELLSNLFEQLIAPTEEGTEPPLRQPNGTYYTPADVADEMVKDALAVAVKDDAPRKVTESQLRKLFGDTDTPLPPMSLAQRKRLTQRIKELRIFDPAVGSGEFLYRTLVALQRALGKLEPDTANPASIVIKGQLSGQDIHPLAVQITRLRLFVAITADHRYKSPETPLPNLEALIVCADTLKTVAAPTWRPDHPKQLDSADPNLIHALTNVAENRTFWFDAHTEEGKQQLLKRDTELRDHLKILLQQKGELANPELVAFANSPLFNLNPIPAHTDTRLLFYENPWRGFDIIIGNPPYEALSKSMDAASRKLLAGGKGYRTVNAGDLYALFCETALALAKPKGGVVTLIVPLSISFGRQKETLRAIFESQCREINLRQYNNNPSMMFHTTPTTKDPRNRQRVTIVTGVLGNTRNPILQSTGLQRWPADERDRCIKHRETARMPRFGPSVHGPTAKQWPRIPTKEVAEMVQATIRQKRTIGSFECNDGVTVALPVAAEYFVSTIPHQQSLVRTEQFLTVPNDETLRLLMATLNGHVAYAWWWVYGDGFHVKSGDFAALTLPDAWVKDPQPAIAIGQRLIDAMPDCKVAITIHQKIWENVNFHLKPDLIAELDRLHIAALGLPEEPLLTHLRIMRSSSSWNYGNG